MHAIGIDAVDIVRLRGVLARTPRLAARLFTEAEQTYAGRARDPATRYAARFAAKEAAMKALGVGLGSFRFRDVEVGRDKTGAPSLVVRGGAATLATARGITRWHVSLSHTDQTAIAVVLAE